MPTAGSKRNTLQTDVNELPMELAIGITGEPVTVQIETRSWHRFAAKVWRIESRALRPASARLELWTGNAPEDRELTSRSLRRRPPHPHPSGAAARRRWRSGSAALKITPGVLHLNEGHRVCRSGNDPRSDARRRHRLRQAVPRSRMTVFTTHTPVPAGHDRFDGHMIEEHLGPIRDALGLNPEGLMALGRVNVQDHGETFCMTVLALKTSRRANAVSCLHGQVSRTMWAGMYPGRGEDEVPIGHITNGIHVHTWLAPQMRSLFDRHIGPDGPARAARRRPGRRSAPWTTANFGRRTSSSTEADLESSSPRAVSGRRRGESGEEVEVPPRSAPTR